MVAYHYAQQMEERPQLPLFVDSGGFALLLPGSRAERRDDGTGVIVTTGGDGAEDVVTPEQVLRFQESTADFGATLDFPIPPGCDTVEAARRQALTIANARWAISRRSSSSMRLFGCVQGWDLDSYVHCADALLEAGYTDLAIGGIVPRLHDRELVLSIVRAVTRLQPQLLHVFGIGKPDSARAVAEAGATSVDSSSYVKAAADGKRWDGTYVADASVFERVRIALDNLQSVRLS